MVDHTSLRRSLTPMLVALGCLMAFNAGAQPAQGTGEVAGCISDVTGEPMPGVTVDVGGSGRHRIVLSDVNGCYAVPDVPSGSYFVFARLQGFVSVTQDNLHVQPGRLLKVDLRMRVAPICECLPFPATLARLWDAADAVVRVRITGHEAGSPEAKYSGAISRVWKRSPTFTATETLTFVRRTEPSEVEPYAVGQEFVLFLKWSSAEQAFVRMSGGGDGMIAAFALENGRVHSAPLADYVRMDTEQFVNQLDSLAKR